MADEERRIDEQPAGLEGGQQLAHRAPPVGERPVLQDLAECSTSGIDASVTGAGE